jgi:hypothetical protein
MGEGPELLTGKMLPKTNKQTALNPLMVNLMITGTMYENIITNQ